MKRKQNKMAATASSHLNILDTRQFQSLTEFCGSAPQDAALARHFWMSVQLQPHIESRLVSSDIKQRLRTSSVKKGSRETDLEMSRQHTDIKLKFHKLQEMKKEKHLAKFNERKQILQEQFAARRWKRLALEEKSGQTFQHPKWWSENNMVKTQENESRNIAMEFQQDIANFEKMKTDI